MKKQFFRLKQLADQAFVNAEKSEVLNHEELQIADSKVEALRSALTAINKKLCPNGPVADPEKRLKKCMEHQLGITLLEESRDEKEDALFHYILKVSGVAEKELAKEFADHEGKVEELVYAPLQKVIDNELPNITKYKHNLKKYILDKDSASNRYNSTKKETIKEDMEEADSKVEQCRDALAMEMFSLLAKENELASCILQLLKLQRGYHESALKNLENVIPQLEQTIWNSRLKKVFGIPLQEHLRVTGRKIAYPLEICVTALAELGIEEEGLFRIAGSLSKVKRLKASIDSGCFSYLIPEYRDVHVLASTLKLYLRELPEPLLTYHLHKDWMQAMQYPDQHKVDVVKRLLQKLPQENRDNLAYLIQFLTRLANHAKNRMSSSNIAIVMAPNLLWSRNDEGNVNMSDCVTANMLVDLLIKESHTFFPDDVGNLCQLSISNLYDEEMYNSRNGSARSTLGIEHVDATSMESLSDSPRPNLRKKKPAAPPVPPITTNAEHHQSIGSYPSGSVTLTRPPKGKDTSTPQKSKTTVGVGTEDDVSLARRRSLSKDDVHSVGADVKALTVTAKPPQPVEYKTTAVHHVGPEQSAKPVAAPRQSLLQDDALKGRKGGGDKSPSLEFGEVQLRRPDVVKPEIPARPASLAPAKRSSLDVDPSLPEKTKCSFYSGPNKQHPSIVNMQNRNEKIQLGHDVMMPEKEKFLGHAPTYVSTLENKFSDVNSNKEQRSRPTSTETKPTLPPKTLNLNKSNEKLNSGSDAKETSNSSEQLNELNENRRSSMRRVNLTHSRARSDGNIMDLQHRTPPSPRSLSKPTEPPPPPPVDAAPPRPKTESTDF